MRHVSQNIHKVDPKSQKFYPKNLVFKVVQNYSYGASTTPINNAAAASQLLTIN